MAGALPFGPGALAMTTEPTLSTAARQDSGKSREVGVANRLDRGRGLIKLTVPCGAAWVLLLAVTPAHATDFAVNYANADTRRWSCRLCEFDKAAGRAGTLSAGGIESTDGEMRFGRDNGIDRAGGYLDLNADYRMGTSSGLLLDFAGRNLGLASRDATLRVHKPRRYGVLVRHREIPRNVARDGRSPFTGTATLSLPDNWVPAFSTAAMTQLAASSKFVELATERSRSDIGAWLNLAPGFTFRTGYFRERKRGIDVTFRDSFYQAAALPQPIDYRVEGVDAGLYYESPALSMALFYATRQFTNREDLLDWQNPYLGATSFGRSATAPGNEADTLSFVSRVRIGRRTTLNATLVRGEARQDVAFLPATTNAFIDLGPIDVPSLNAQRESLSAAVNLVSRPMSRLRVSVAHTVTDRSDGRRSIAFTPVLGDLFATPALTARGYDYKRTKTDLALRYRLPGRLNVAAGFRHLESRRSNLEISGNDENRAWLELTGDVGAGWWVRARHARADRDASEFVANTLNNPLTRRYYQADRHDTEWSGGIRFNSTTTGFSMGLDVNYREHDYPHSPLGLQRDATTGWLVDVAYAQGNTASVSGFYGVQTRKSKTAGSAAYPTRDWLYATEDAVTTAGARFRAHGFPLPAVDLTVDYACSSGVGDYTTTLEAVRSGFPSLISRHRSVDARLRYAWQHRTTVFLRYYFERFRATDWATDGIEQDGIRNVLTFGRSSPRYSNHLIALSVERKL